MTPGIPGVDGTVNAFLVYDDGSGPKLIVAGGFLVAGNTPAKNIAQWDGQEWSNLGNGLGRGESDSVSSLGVFDGKLIASGSFTVSGSQTVGRIAQWDGTSWTALPSSNLPTVGSMANFEGKLIVPGSFTSIGGVSANRIAAWDGSSWSPLGNGMTGGTSPSVSTVYVHDGRLYASGQFQTAGNVSANRIACWDGNEWSALGSGINNVARVMTSFNGQLVVGGEFSQAGGVSASRIATWNGQSWSTMGAGFNNTVYSLAERQGVLFASGLFSQSGAVTVNQFARWNGANWVSVASDTASATGYELCVFNSDLVVGGNSLYFQKIDGVPISGVAKWDGTDWSRLGDGLNDYVLDIGKYNGDLIVTGRFQLPDPKSGTSRVARLTSAGWEPLGDGLSSTGSAITTFEDDLIVGGSFQNSGSLQVNRIARFDGESWNSVGSGFNDYVADLIVYNNSLIAGGAFTMSGAVPAKRVAVWNGSQWATLGNGFNDGAVGSFCVFRGELFACGNFNTSGSTTMPGIARWDGANWNSLGATNTTPSCMTVWNDNLIVVGMFSSMGSSGRNVARWNGTAWSSMGTLSETVYSVANVSSTLFAAGSFRTFGFGQNNGLSKWNGSSWTPVPGGVSGWQPFIFCSRSIDGELFLGGTFAAAEDFASGHFARYSAAPPEITQQPEEVSSCLGDSVNLTAEVVGTGLVTYRWMRDGVPMVDEGNITGAETAVLMINPVDLTDAGSYTVVATDECRSTESLPSFVTIACCSARPNGDLNGDGATDGLDISLFMDAVLVGSRAGAVVCKADFTYDHVMTDADIGPFVAKLLDE